MTSTVNRQVNLCLLAEAPLLAFLWILRNHAPQDHRFLVPLTFGAGVVLFAVCEIFLPGFAHDPGDRVTLITVSVALSRLSFGLWGAAVLCHRLLPRVILCATANLVAFGLPLTVLLFWQVLRAGNGPLLTLVTSVPLVIISCPAIFALASKAKPASPM